jgi:hypothetical protein
MVVLTNKQKLVNQTIGLFLLLFSFVFSGLGAVLAVSIKDDVLSILKKPESSVGDVSYKTCINIANKMKIASELKPNKDIYFSIHEIEYPSKEFAQMSALVMACQYYDIKYMCIGTGCKKSQFEVILTPFSAVVSG